MPNVSNLLIPVTAVALALTPVPKVGLALALLVVADLALAVLIARLIRVRRRKTTSSIVMLDDDLPMHLLRRTEPALRAHRPIGVVETQVRWRQAAEAHRRNHKKARNDR